MLAMDLPLRATQAVFSLVTLGLVGYCCQWFRSHSTGVHSPSQVSFLLFASVWALVITPALFFLPRKVNHTITKWVVLALDLMTQVFTFAGFVALAVFQHKLILCYGHICQVMIASIAFGGLLWALFLASTILSGINAMRKAETTANVSDKERELEMSPPATRGTSEAVEAKV